jgi:preprotein translocase subunit SecE
MAVERKLNQTDGKDADNVSALGTDITPDVAKKTSTSAQTQMEKEPVKGGGLIGFIKQIISEMKKVVTPTRQELIEYVIVVLVFVLVIMLFITGVDMAIGQLVMGLFAK